MTAPASPSRQTQRDTRWRHRSPGKVMPDHWQPNGPQIDPKSSPHRLEICRGSVPGGCSVGDLERVGRKVTEIDRHMFGERGLFHHKQRWDGPFSTSPCWKSPPCQTQIPPVHSRRAGCMSGEQGDLPKWCCRRGLFQPQHAAKEPLIHHTCGEPAPRSPHRLCRSTSATFRPTLQRPP